MTNGKLYGNSSMGMVADKLAIVVLMLLVIVVAPMAQNKVDTLATVSMSKIKHRTSPSASVGGLYCVLNKLYQAPSRRYIYELCNNQW